ncbi:hypothetical protein [Streptomyces flavalbus]|uniref:Uncharacterized protein n=1 Tax=Streptomyces flavalbus TaxID=2665155 RepID=A0ABW2WII3_9ACTN
MRGEGGAELVLPRSTELIARVFLMSCLLRTGDLAAWEQQLDHCHRLLKEAPRPELESIVRVGQTARAALDGRWDEAEELVDAHTSTRFAATSWGARWRTRVTTYTCRRGQGRVAEVVDDLVTAAAEPDMTPLRPVAILAAAEAGQPDRGRELLARWGTDLADDWTADFLLPVRGLIAAHLATPDPQDLYDRLLPHADQRVPATVAALTGALRRRGQPGRRRRGRGPAEQPGGHGILTFDVDSLRGAATDSQGRVRAAGVSLPPASAFGQEGRGPRHPRTAGRRILCRMSGSAP